MRIQPMKNSEAFDAYAAIMNQYIQKRASATSAFMRELPGFADELAQAGGVAATKIALETPDDFLGLWKEVFKANYEDMARYVNGAEDFLKAGTDPRLQNPEFLSSVIEQLTLAKKQTRRILDFIEPPSVKPPTEGGEAALKSTSEELFSALLEEFRIVDDVIAQYTAKLGEAQAAAARAAAGGAGEAGERAVREGLEEGVGEAGERAAREGLEEGAEELGERGAREGIEEGAEQAADIAAGPAATATQKIVQAAGEGAAPVVQQEVKVLSEGAKDLGGAEGAKEALDALAAQGASNRAAIDALAESLKESIDAMKRELAEGISKATDDVAEAGGDAVAGNAKRLDAIEQSFTELVQEVRRLAKEAAKGGADAAPDTARGAAGLGFREWIRSSMAGGAVWGGVKLAGKIALGVAALGGIYYLGTWLLADDERAAAYQAELTRLQQAILNATAAHKALQFNELTQGKEHNDDMLQELDDNKNSATTLSAQNLSNPDNYDAVVAASEQLDELDAETREFLAVKDRIAGDLSDPNGWEAAIAADQELVQAIGRVNAAIQRAIQEAERNGAGGSSTGQRDGQGQGGSNGDPSASGPIGEGGEEGRVILDVYGEQIDITGKPAGFRSAAPRMAHRLLSSPYGMAFVDPHDRWGGFIRKTGRPQVDYLNALGYLYKEGVFTPGQLRRFIRHAIPKQGRRRHSGWKNAVKYYRRHPVSHKTASNILINESLVKESTNRFDIGMRKMADQYPNQYISDAISGLSDQYSKSYYAGLKSQYNSKADKPRADYKELYEVHGEKGSDLIQAAHPEAIVVSDSMGNGGLVENLLEQKSHSEGVAKSAPTGNFRGKHANLEVIEALNKLANQADEAGFFEVSDLIEQSITTILNK